MKAPICRTCHSENVAAIGALPDGHVFAGRALRDPLPGGKLWRCRDCDFRFRHPLLASADYEQLYREGSAEVWEAANERKDFSLIRQQLAEAGHHAAIDVLDVGCYTGRLLTSLPKDCRLYGVEPNAAAARVAVERGVTIVAQTVEELARVEKTFDVIMACDVIEHVVDPLTFLRQLRAQLREGGRLLVSTGDGNSWLWRLGGANYWYCYFPEHISFVGRRWLGTMPGRAGLRVEDLIPFNYAGAASPLSAVRALAAIGYGWAPKAYRTMSTGVRGDTVASFTPPGCGASKDHLLCTLRLT